MTVGRGLDGREAARVAASDDAQAAAWPRDLDVLTGESVAELQAGARVDARRPARIWRNRRPTVNLFMMDAM